MKTKMIMLLTTIALLSALAGCSPNTSAPPVSETPDEIAPPTAETPEELETPITGDLPSLEITEDMEGIINNEASIFILTFEFRE